MPTDQNPVTTTPTVEREPGRAELVAYNREADMLEYSTEDAPIVWRAVGSWLEIGFHMDDRDRIVGLRIHRPFRFLTLARHP